MICRKGQRRIGRNRLDIDACGLGSGDDGAKQCHRIGPGNGADLDLGLSEVGTRDNFFELGGHSLLAVQAHREIVEATGAKLTVTDIFRFPTIAALADHLEGDGGSNEALQKSADRAAARRQALGRRRVLRRR